MKTDDALERKADRFWSMDLAELERSFGVENAVESLSVDKIDERIPPQGSVLMDRIAYLPKDETD